MLDRTNLIDRARNLARFANQAAGEPWDVHTKHDTYDVISYRDGHTLRIATCDDSPPRINGLVNAKLIARVPEMVRLLNEMADALEKK